MGGTPPPLSCGGERGNSGCGVQISNGGSAFKPLGCRASARKPFPTSSFRTAGKYGADLEQSSFYSAATIF